MRLFRVGTNLVSEPLFHDWRNILLELGTPLAGVKIAAQEYGIRLTVHAAYIHLGTTDELRLQQARDHLEYLSGLLDAVGNADSVIEVHIGGLFKQSHKGRAKQRAIEFIQSLPMPIRTRLALENDEMWGVADVRDICDATGSQFLYDVFHHRCWPYWFTFNDANIINALWLARTSAGMRTPLVHVSSQAHGRREGAHADLIHAGDYDRLRRNFDAAYMDCCDIMIEAGAKEGAVQDIRARLAARPPKWAAKSEGYYV